MRGLSKHFGTQLIVDHVNLTVPSGQLLTILGASGSGKTSLLRLIAGFERADSGTIHIDGEMVTGAGIHEPPERRRIGYVAQEGALFPHLSVAENIGFGLKKHVDRASRATDLLDLVGLPAAYASRAPHQLSGGEQQRVALARALASSPRLILLDEPFSALDAALRQELRDQVKSVLAEAGATAILVTHDQAEALSMGDQVVVLRDGRIVQMAAPSVLYHQPADTMLAQFVGEAVLLPGKAVSGRAICAFGDLALANPSQGPVELLIRPEQIKLVALGTSGSVAAQVRAMSFFGHDALVQLKLDAAPELLVNARVFGHELPEPGRAVGLIVEKSVVAFPSRDTMNGCS